MKHKFNNDFDILVSNERLTHITMTGKELILDILKPLGIEEALSIQEALLDALDLLSKFVYIESHIALNARPLIE
jgi:hypothetical protein